MIKEEERTTKRRSIENGRAKAAYSYVESVKNETFAKEYKSYIEKLAPLIKTNGLGNTIAFIYSKKGNSNSGQAYEKIYDRLEEWLKEQGLIEQNLLKEIVLANSRSYRQMTKETLSLANWWRRFVDGMIERN